MNNDPGTALKSACLLALLLTQLAVHAASDSAALYTQKGTDPSFESLLAKKVFPIGSNSSTGVTGSKITINPAWLKTIKPSSHPIPQDIKIHTLCNSVIPRKDFAKWTRWYQEDGKIGRAHV